LQIPSNRHIALIGPSDVHKKIIIDLITGMKLPDAGRVIRNARVSFPVGTVPGAEQSLSLALNTAHVARLYGQDEDEIVGFVRRIYRLDGSFNRTFGQLDGAERKRFARILAFAIPFDTYVLADDRMTPDCAELFEARARTAGVIINVLNNKDFARKYCDTALVVRRGQLQLFGNAQALLAREKSAAGRPKKRGPARRPDRTLEDDADF
jgi:capsular polysaccharide transport system ATP-binding protein